MMKAIMDVLIISQVNVLRERISYCLETHNVEQAARILCEGHLYLPQAELNDLVADLESSYYEFT
jgi:hypothetical protein